MKTTESLRAIISFCLLISLSCPFIVYAENKNIQKLNNALSTIYL